MAEPSAVEIKLNIMGDVDHALSVLGLGGGKPRKVWFLDDLTEGARPPLPLLTAGIVLRLHRNRDGGEDSTVKLRPCRWSQLVGQWGEGPSGDTDLTVEGDWSRSKHVLAASCKADLDEGSIESALEGNGRLVNAFTKSQLDFLADCGEIRVAFGGLTPLGPIAAIQWKNATIGAVDHVSAERWTVAGADFLELSIRVTDVRQALGGQQELTDEVMSRGLSLDDADEPKTLRVMKLLADAQQPQGW
ncbi:hypothetical protein A5792_03955 [Mycolicibacterium peregrinum]|uniref:CYTH domain-containing protein n=2 Tax=Mycolicibacterium peregrinum TaxID=43304 RepID=A0A1A0QXL6_MYCPR|nr:hypothetical protein A5792_03955 [Mycolicibacterium peregrinum]